MSLILRPMTDDETKHYIASNLDSYVAEHAANSGVSEDEVRRRAKEQHASYFPDGRPAPRHQLLIAESNGQAVGQVWVGPHPYRPEVVESTWLYDIEIYEPFRGQGYGRSCLELVEAELVQQGVTELGLNVFGDNDTARHLYASAEYREVAVSMTKNLFTQD